MSTKALAAVLRAVVIGELFFLALISILALQNHTHIFRYAGF